MARGGGGGGSLTPGRSTRQLSPWREKASWAEFFRSDLARRILSGEISRALLKTYYARIAAAAILAGLIVLVVAVLSRDGDREREGDGSARGAAPAPTAQAPAVGDVPASERRRLGRVDPETASETPEVRDLQRGAPGSPSEREPAPAARLPEGTASVTFAVRDESDRPLEEVSVSLRWLQRGGIAEEGMTGSDGEVLFADLAAGRYAYRVEAPGRPDRASAASLRLEEGERKFLTLRLGPSNLSISGRVLNQDGEPVPGIEISVVRSLYASSTSHEVVLENRPAQKTRTDQDGAYAIQGLEEGEYYVRTTATDLYASVQTVVRAGSDSADLLLVEQLRVHGTVTNESGEPLARVRVVQLEDRGRVAQSDDQGGYQLHLANEGDVYTLEFFLQGYEEESLVLEAAQVRGARAVRLDAELRALSEAATVSGVVRTTRGEPVQGVRVFLYSLPTGTNYQAHTDQDGNFSIPDVKIDTDYRLSVLPRSDYRDYREEPLEVTRSGVWLDIVLEPLASGRLTGRMIDLEGNPIPHFRLWLVNAEAQHSSLPVSSDDSGYFHVEEAPEGQLAFDTRSNPVLRVSGIDLPAGGEREVLLPLDWGDHEVFGSVLDDTGFPVPGADVYLYWSHQDGEIQSTSRRETVTDESGLFRFSQLGLGVHRLDVRASAFHAMREEIDVGSYPSEVEILLEPLSP